MLASLRPRWRRSFAEFDSHVTKYAPVILCGLLAATTFHKVSLILHTDGGGDLLGADIPKSVMLIAGQNPYSSNPWASRSEERRVGKECGSRMARREGRRDR